MVNVFLPTTDLEANARILDNKRLYKQCVEIKQILNTLLLKRRGITVYPDDYPVKSRRGKRVGYLKHPAVIMFEGQEFFLYYYLELLLKEWFHRTWPGVHIMFFSNPPLQPPLWFGKAELHASHQSKLVAKDPEHYRKYFPGVIEGLEYVWPYPVHGKEGVLWLYRVGREEKRKPQKMQVIPEHHGVCSCPDCLWADEQEKKIRKERGGIDE